MTGPVNVKQISTLNVKSARSGKCEKHSTLNVEFFFAQLHGQFGQFGQPGQFFSRNFRVSGCQKKFKILGSVMILRENILIQEWAGGISWGFRCKKIGGGRFGG